MENVMMPLQPYLMLTAKNLKIKKENHCGISHFYQNGFLDEKNEINAVPDGCIDLVFSFDDDNVHTMIGGTVLKAAPWTLEKNKECFGVRFSPGNDVLPKPLTVDMLINKDFTIDGNIFGDHLEEKLMEAESLEHRVRIFIEAYEKLLFEYKQDDMKKGIEKYVRERIINTAGTIAIQDLIAETGYSECYIRRIFKQYNGISPKQFAKFIRFQYLLSEIKKDSSIEELAMRCNYYDEAHMIKEFKCFAGMTVEKYKKNVLPKILSDSSI